MTGDVLSYGDERPPRNRPRPLVALAVAAALAVGGVAVARSRTSAHKQPPGWTDYPSVTPSGPSGLLGGPIHADPFAGAFTIARPNGGITGIVLPSGIPGFLVWREDRARSVYEAVGGPSTAPLLVGWCAPWNRFQDQSGAYVYSTFGDALRSGTGLVSHDVRLHAGDPRRVDVALAGQVLPPPATDPIPARRCPERLVYPPLPPRTTDVQATRGAHRLIRGRYVVTTETVAFCAAVRPAGCADQGWERYAPDTAQTLDPGDLAGSYTWEGDFLVQANSSDGTLSVVLTPTARLVRRDHVGAAARVGLAHGTFRRNGVLHLHFNPVQILGTSVIDDSPPGTPETRGNFPYAVRDVRGGLRDYVIRSDAEFILGHGVTGLGYPKATTDTLRRFVDQHPDTPLWLILDRRGRVIRVVAEREVVLTSVVVDPVPPSP